MRYLVAVGALAGALVIAAPAGAKTLHGTVVHQNTSEKSFVVAARSGALTEVSARTSPAIARVVDVKVRRARGGSTVARRIRSRGTARRARLRGRVSFAGAHSFAISAGGASILVHDSRTPPPVGSTVTTDVTFGAGEDLEADDVQEDNHGEHGPAAGAMKIEGTIQAIDPTARTLTVFADDDEEDDAGPSKPTVTVHVPASIDITQFAVGDEVELVVVPQGDGSFLLQSVDDDQGDDDQGEDNGNDQGAGGVEQGDDNGDQGDSGHGGD